MSDTSAPSVELPTRRATRQLARALARALQPGDAIILSGALGAGKTFLVRALCRALGLDAGVRVVSPTFTLVRELDTVPRVAHADLYRLTRPEDAHELGLGELRERGMVLLVEWGASHAEALGPDRLTLAIELGPRRALLAADGPRSEALRQGVIAALAPAP
ncbi:MAG TPA: tRNA (adenosine(37)-N6)-threonylcarbamoyltransferase complex ATPase subunit type 1 TsaE [Polyangiaceae bacterium]|nr:tRNA (adenosine(37)-N6)-threonylcarbamoyltransferase complex ATPase subunit type 1 TsaE [Polyangiaceae bacterium]